MLRKNLPRAYEIDAALKNIEEQIAYIEKIEARSETEANKGAVITIYGSYEKAAMDFDFDKGKEILLNIINETKTALEKELAELK